MVDSFLKGVSAYPLSRVEPSYCVIAEPMGWWSEPEAGNQYLKGAELRIVSCFIREIFCRREVTPEVDKAFWGGFDIYNTLVILHCWLKNSKQKRFTVCWTCLCSPSPANYVLTDPRSSNVIGQNKYEALERKTSPSPRFELAFLQTLYYISNLTSDLWD